MRLTEPSCGAADRTQRKRFESAPSDGHWRSASFLCQWLTRLGVAVSVSVFGVILTSSALAHDHGGGSSGGGSQSHQQSSHWHNNYSSYRDPFWGSYAGYSGAYDSSYCYTPTAEQRATAQKQVQAYLAAVNKKQKKPASRRYIAVKTLRPTKKQLQDYLSKREAAKSAAAGGGAKLSDRWVEPEKLQCMMVFDTQSKQFVGSGCYVVASTPPIGTTAKFETFTAEVVGNSVL